MIWQEKWIHPHAYRRKCSSTDAAMLIATMIELARLVAKTIAGAGTDYAKCFDLIPQEISQETTSKLGMAQGVSNAMGGMYKQLQRAFKMNSSLGKFFAATNGILQGCALSAIYINALMSIRMKQVDETAGAGYEVTVQALPAIPRANQDMQT